MKDSRNITIIILLIFCGVLGSMWYTSNSGYQEKIANIEAKKQQLNQEYEILNKEFAQLKNEYQSLQRKEIGLIDKVRKSDREIEGLVKKLHRSQQELFLIKKELAETQKKIEELKRNPINRANEDLLNSLKIKLEI